MSPASPKPPKDVAGRRSDRAPTDRRAATSSRPLPRRARGGLSRSQTAGFGVLCLLLVTAAGCTPDVKGRLIATRTGDLIEPSLRRVDASEAARASCGAPVSADGLLRSPYVQQVSAQAANLRWVSSAAEESVVVWEPETEPSRVSSRPLRTRFLRSGTQRQADLRGLRPSRLYCYALERAGVRVFGPEGFRTAPDATDDATVRVLAFGDSGDGSRDQRELRSQMSTVAADVILHMGDLVYPGGSMAGLEAYAFDVYDGLFSRAPFYPTLGNHDVRTANGGPFLEAFDLPRNAHPEGRYYSFDHGAVHFVALETGAPSDEQLEWLDDDLAANELPWTIVYGHHPAYSSGHHGDDETIQRTFLPILERHRVQLVLAGHDHHYERIEPGGGTTFVVTGAGGYSTRDAEEQGPSAFAEAVTHFVSIEVTPTEMRIYAVDASGRVFDAARVLPAARPSTAPGP